MSDAPVSSAYALELDTYAKLLIAFHASEVVVNHLGDSHGEAAQLLHQFNAAAQAASRRALPQLDTPDEAPVVAALVAAGVDRKLAQAMQVELDAYGRVRSVLAEGTAFAHTVAYIVDQRLAGDIAPRDHAFHIQGQRETIPLTEATAKAVRAGFRAAQASTRGHTAFQANADETARISAAASQGRARRATPLGAAIEGAASDFVVAHLLDEAVRSLHFRTNNENGLVAGKAWTHAFESRRHGREAVILHELGNHTELLQDTRFTNLLHVPADMGAALSTYGYLLVAQRMDVVLDSLQDHLQPELLRSFDRRWMQQAAALYEAKASQVAPQLDTAKADAIDLRSGGIAPQPLPPVG